MNKKRISVVMATAMAASMAAVPMTASADDTVELTFMGWEASPLETQAVQDGIAKFEEQYPNIKVNYTKDLGTILVGEAAVREGLINEVGGISDALRRLYTMIAARKAE